MPSGSSEIFEREALERLEAANAAAEAPQMNAAVGRLTYMDAYQQQQMALHGKRMLDSQLAAIRTALQRVHKGSYGICEACGGPIPPERLEYMPETAYCVNCQR